MFVVVIMGKEKTREKEVDDWKIFVAKADVYIKLFDSVTTCKETKLSFAS